MITNRIIPLPIFLAFLLCGIGYVIGAIKIVHQGTEGIVERLGQYRRSLKPGLNFVFPLIDTVLVETTREQILDVPPQLAITKDGIPLEINAVIFWKLLDVQRAYYSIDDLEEGFLNIIRSGIRDEVGRLELEEVFASRSRINMALLHKVDIISERWGSKVLRVEIQDILLAKAVLGEVPDTIEFSFHNGIDWAAFKYSFNLVIENEGLELSIQSIEDKGNGELVVRVKVPPDANKAQLYKDFTTNYEAAFQLVEAKYQAELKARDDQITIYRQQSADMKEIISLLANRPVNVEVNATAESKSMNESTDQSSNYGGISQNISGGSVYGGIQAAQGSGNVQSQKIHSIASSDQGLTQDQVIQLFAQLESVLRQPELQGEVQTKAIKYLEAAKEEVQAKEPDKQLAAGNLKRMAETIETTSKTMEASKKIWETTKPILEKILPWLGVAKSFFGF